MNFTTIGEVVSQYGIAIAVLGALSVALVGLLKISFKKELAKLSKENRKITYEAMSIGASLLMAGICFLLTGGNSAELYFQEAGMTYAVAKVLYPLYENFRLRDVVQFVIKKAEEWLKNKEDGNG